MGKLSYGSGFNESAGQVHVDPRLEEILRAAAQAYGLDVQFTSGVAGRAAGTHNHDRGHAVDIQLVDPQTGRALPNYQNAASFQAYEQFAQTARVYQQQKYPDLDKDFRWGGYFNSKTGPSGYGAVDLMHFDVTPGAPSPKLGSWETGASKALLAAYPGAVSNGGLAGPNGGRLASAYQQQLAGGPMPPGTIPSAPQPASMSAGLAAGRGAGQQMAGDPDHALLAALLDWGGVDQGDSAAQLGYAPQPAARPSSRPTIAPASFGTQPQAPTPPAAFSQAQRQAMGNVVSGSFNAIQPNAPAGVYDGIYPLSKPLMQPPPIPVMQSAELARTRVRPGIDATVSPSPRIASLDLSSYPRIQGVDVTPGAAPIPAPPLNRNAPIPMPPLARAPIPADMGDEALMKRTAWSAQPPPIPAAPIRDPFLGVPVGMGVMVPNANARPIGSGNTLMGGILNHGIAQANRGSLGGLLGVLMGGRSARAPAVRGGSMMTQQHDPRDNIWDAETNPWGGN